MLVSKEVSTLENEMLEFKEALAEWKGMPSLLHIDDSASVAGESDCYCSGVVWVGLYAGCQHPGTLPFRAYCEYDHARRLE